MKLGSWLKDRNMTHEEFGALIDRDHSSVTRYVNGTRMPSRSTLTRITQETGGEVTANDFVDVVPIETSGSAKLSAGA